MDYKQKRWSLMLLTTVQFLYSHFFLKVGPGAVLSPAPSPVWIVYREAHCPGLLRTEISCSTGFLLLKPEKFQAPGQVGSPFWHGYNFSWVFLHLHLGNSFHLFAYVTASYVVRPHADLSFCFVFVFVLLLFLYVTHILSSSFLRTGAKEVN